MKINKELYNHKFYVRRDEKTKHIAKEIFRILDLYDIKFESIADVGGG